MRVKRKAVSSPNQATEPPPAKKAKSIDKDATSTPGSRYNTRGKRIRLPGILTGRYDDDNDDDDDDGNTYRKPTYTVSTKGREEPHKTCRSGSSKSSTQRRQGRLPKNSKTPVLDKEKKTTKDFTPANNNLSPAKRRSTGIFSRTITNNEEQSPTETPPMSSIKNGKSHVQDKIKAVCKTPRARKFNQKVLISRDENQDEMKSVVQQILELSESSEPQLEKSNFEKHDKSEAATSQNSVQNSEASAEVHTQKKLPDTEPKKTTENGGEIVDSKEASTLKVGNVISPIYIVNQEQSKAKSKNKELDAGAGYSLTPAEDEDDESDLFESGSVTVKASFAQQLSLDTMVNLVQETGVRLVSEKNGQLVMDGKWNCIRKACLKFRQLRKHLPLGSSDSQKRPNEMEFESDIPMVEGTSGWSSMMPKNNTNKKDDSSLGDQDDNLSDVHDNEDRNEKSCTSQSQQDRTAPVAGINVNQTMEDLLSQLDNANTPGTDILFRCHLCKDFSAPLSNLKAHYYARHNFPCGKCGKLLFTSQSYKSHKCDSVVTLTSPKSDDQTTKVETMDSDELSGAKPSVSPLWCPKCQSLCKTTTERDRHVIAKQKKILEPFQCSACTFSTFKCALFKKHQEIHDMFPSTVPIKQIKVKHESAAYEEEPGEYEIEVKGPSAGNNDSTDKATIAKDIETGSLKMEVEVVPSGENEKVEQENTKNVEAPETETAQHESVEDPSKSNQEEKGNVDEESKHAKCKEIMILKKWKKEAKGPKSQEDGKNMVECDICGNLNVNQLSALEHQYKCHNQWMFQCHLCENRFTDLEMLNVHYNRHIDPDFDGYPQPIPDASEVVVNLEEEETHVSVDGSPRRKRPGAAKRYSDEFCDSDQKKSKLKKIRKPINKVDLWCDKCQTQCESLWEMNKHRSNKYNKPVHMKWKCQDCGYLTINCSQYKSHQEIHRKYVNVAPLIYVRVKHIAVEGIGEDTEDKCEEDHEKLEETTENMAPEGDLADGIKAIKCEIDAGSEAANDEPEIIELPEGQSVEDVDLDGFKDVYMKKWKKYRHWNKDKYKDPSMLKYECEVCGLLVPTSKLVHNHRRSVHPQWMFKCKLCDQLYDRTIALNKHYNLHFTEMYQCHKCIRQFKLLTNFMLHLKTHEESNATVDDEILSRCVIPASESELLKDKLEKLLGEQAERDQKTNLTGDSSKSLVPSEEQSMGLLDLKWRGLPDDMIKICPLCSFKATKKDLISHRKTYHPKYMYKCDLCKREIREPRTFLKHYEMHFDKDGNLKPVSWRVGYEYGKHRAADYKCEKCCRTFFRSVDLRHHSKVHERPEKFQCPHCPLVSTSKYNFMDHMARKHGTEERYQCSHCPKNYALMKDLTYHIDTEHLETKRAKCEICGQQFKDKRYVARHMMRHKGTKRFFCKTCGRGFYEPLRFRNHMDTHKPLSERQSRFKCTYCDKGFSSKFVCKEHENLHTGEKPYKCTICPSTFASYNGFRRHKLFHNDVRPFVCTEPGCSKAFTMKHKLTAHIVTHTLQSKYKCELCGKCYTCGSTLRKHACLGKIEDVEANPVVPDIQQYALVGSLAAPTHAGTLEVESALTAMINDTEVAPGSDLVFQVASTTSTDDATAPSTPSANRELYMCSICDRIFHTWEEIQIHMLGHSMEGVAAQQQQETVEVDPQSLHFTIVDGTIQGLQNPASEIFVSNASDEVIADDTQYKTVDVTTAAATLADLGLTMPITQ